VRVDCCDNGFGSGYNYGVGSSDFMESRGGAAMGKETALHFLEAVARFRVNVIGAIGAGFHFSNLSVVAVWKRWRMRSWHLCLIVSGHR
jgi:hypothetical protein